MLDGGWDAAMARGWDDWKTNQAAGPQAKSNWERRFQQADSFGAGDHTDHRTRQAALHMLCEFTNDLWTPMSDSVLTSLPYSNPPAAPKPRPSSGPFLCGAANQTRAQMPRRLQSATGILFEDGSGQSVCGDADRGERALAFAAGWRSALALSANGSVALLRKAG